MVQFVSGRLSHHSKQYYDYKSLTDEGLSSFVLLNVVFFLLKLGYKKEKNFGPVWTFVSLLHCELPVDRIGV